MWTLNEQPNTPQPAHLPGVSHVLAVASGKGGVGKSTTAVNLALAMARAGLAVGLLDADIYGPNVPVMMGSKVQPEMDETRGMIPVERFGVKFISLGLIAGDGVPIVWRGPMLAKMLSQFLHDVAWAPLDCLLIDLPPGTGDVQLTLAQSVAISGALIVTTPQEIALEDVRRGIRMFETVNVPVMGILENMSYYICPSCDKKHAIFAEGGGRKTADHFEVPFLGEVPLSPALRAASDTGSPLVDPSDPVAIVYNEIAQNVIGRLAN
jgi:ATP-binding protein involved in chromosome partitioning